LPLKNQIKSGSGKFKLWLICTDRDGNLTSSQVFFSLAPPLCSQRFYKCFNNYRT